MSSVTLSGSTDMGKIRTNNEDAYIAQYIWDKNHILAVAIDGVGGYEGGEVAAALARKGIIEYLENYPNGERLELLKQAVVWANNTIFSERKNQPQYGNMSCVLTAVLVELKAGRINMVHVGDTRLYQFANGELTKLSHDHSLVGYREEIGELTEEEAMKHPQRNVIGRDVGSTLLDTSDDDYVEVSSFPLSKSTLLLCSDGLCDMLTSAQMTSVLQKDLTVDKKVLALIDAANAAGGKDNVTVVLVDINIDDNPLMTYTEEKTPLKDEDMNVTSVETTTSVGSINRKKREIKMLVVGIILFALGYFVGGFSAQKILPSIFGPDEIKADTTGIRHEMSTDVNESSEIQDSLSSSTFPDSTQILNELNQCER